MEQLDFYKKFIDAYGINEFFGFISGKKNELLDSNCEYDVQFTFVNRYGKNIPLYLFDEPIYFLITPLDDSFQTKYVDVIFSYVTYNLTTYQELQDKRKSMIGT